MSGPTWSQLDPTGAYVSGVGGEVVAGVGAGWGWGPGDRERLTTVTSSLLLERYALPLHPELLRRADEWLNGLPDLDPLDQLALFKQEMAVGCWGGSLTTGYPDAYSFTHYPYAHRRIIDAVLRLPFEYRILAPVRRDIVASRWPELLAFDFNRRPRTLAARRTTERYARGAVRRIRRTARTLKRRLRRPTDGPRG